MNVFKNVAVMLPAMVAACPGSQVEPRDLIAEFEEAASTADIVHGAITSRTACSHDAPLSEACAAQSEIQSIAFDADWFPITARLDPSQPVLRITTAAARDVPQVGVAGYYRFEHFGPLIEDDQGYTVTCGDEVAQTGWRYLVGLQSSDENLAIFSAAHDDVRAAIERGSAAGSMSEVIQLGLECPTEP